MITLSSRCLSITSPLPQPAHSTPSQKWKTTICSSRHQDTTALCQVPSKRHNMCQPACEPELKTLLQLKTYAAPITPPRTPTKQKVSGTSRTQILYDRPRPLSSIDKASLLSNNADQQRHPLDRSSTVEDAPSTPPESPLQLFSLSIDNPSSSNSTASTKNTANDADKRDEVIKPARERVMGRLGRKYPGKKLFSTTLNTTSDGLVLRGSLGG